MQHLKAMLLHIQLASVFTALRYLKNEACTKVFTQLLNVDKVAIRGSIEVGYQTMLTARK